jgi:hypothetical protein
MCNLVACNLWGCKFMVVLDNENIQKTFRCGFGCCTWFKSTTYLSLLKKNIDFLFLKSKSTLRKIIIKGFHFNSKNRLVDD